MTVALKDLASRQLVAAEVEAVAAVPCGSHRQFSRMVVGGMKQYQPLTEVPVGTKMLVHAVMTD